MTSHQELKEALDRHDGNVSAAARSLGIARATMRCRMGQEDEPSIGRHFVVPDTQIKPGVDTEHLTWAAKYCSEKRIPTIVMLGDWADLPSLSSHDGPKSFEGRRYKADIAAAKKGMEKFLEPILKTPDYNPRMVMLLGNHENRITRKIEDHPEFEGLISTDDLGYEDAGWEVQPFLKIIKIDGLAYSHYFYHPMSGRAYGGNCHTKLKNIGMSFVMGHQQGLDMAPADLPDESVRWGLVAGSFYTHREDYKGWQGNNHWRGVVVLNEVENGSFDPMPLSMRFLKRRYG